MAVELPFEPTVPFQEFGTTLDGTQFNIRLRWNARANINPVSGLPDGAWYFDLLTEDEQMIRAGIKIVLGTLLGGRSSDARFPNGILKAVDLSDTTGRGGREATLDDLGVRVVVYFFTVEEMAAIE